MRKIIRFLKYIAGRCFVIIFVSILAIVLLQDFIILPYFRESLIHRYFGRGSTAVELGPEVTQIFVSSPLGRKIEIYRFQPPENKRIAGRAALIFRGNGGPLSQYLVIAKSLAKFGATSYLVNYPGMGDSKGWPSEGKINQDAAQVWRYITEKEQADPNKLIVVGYSFGTGPASWLSMVREPAAAVLLAPYPSLPEVVNTVPYYRHLAPLLWYDFPVKDYISELKKTCLIVATVENDQTIPKSLSDGLASLYRGQGGVWRISTADGSHDSIYSSNEPEILTALQECESKVSGSSPVKLP